MRTGIRSLTLLVLLALMSASAQTSTPAPPPAEAPPPQSSPPAKPAESGSSWRLSGYMFGDYYYFASSHDPTIEGQNGFWLRRAYFTYDATLTQGFSTRFRLEVNSSGDFTNTKLTPYVKDAYLRWAHGAHALLFGISPTPTWEFIEGFWGYRFVEKTPLDLQRWDGSRDFGIAAQGTLDKDKTVNYHVMVGNGSDTGSETNENKAVRGALSYRGRSGFVAEGYADWQDQPNGADRSTLQAFVGYRKPAGRLGIQYARQTRRSATAADITFDLASVFGIARIDEKNFLIARLDRMFDPNPDGRKIPYLPFDPRAKAAFGLLGWDHVPIPNVHVTPNLEIVRYGAVRGAPIATDVVPRVTLYVVWP